MIQDCLITADIHLTSKERDEYRWLLFDWIIRQVETHRLKEVHVLGDVTDAKDNHSSKLVNRIVRKFVELSKVAKVNILLGNHDYLQEGYPFFEFLNEFENIHFITDITESADGKIIYLPHTKTPKEDWADINFDDYEYGFLHQTVNGAIASNGMAMEGEMRSVATRSSCRFISGDIHLPQDIHGLTYVGSPYHVHFGDRFKARSIMVKSGKERDLHLNTLEKFTVVISSVEELEEIKVRSGDQLKVRLDLPQSLMCDWSRIKSEVDDWCHHKGVDLLGLEIVPKKKRKMLLGSNQQAAIVSARCPVATIRRFAEHESLDPAIVDLGVGIVS